MTTADPVVGVTMLFSPDGTPEGVAEITRADAVAARFAFECALAADDPLLINRLIREIYETEDSESLLVMQKAFILMLTSVVRPALKTLGAQADSLREMFRHCADEFNSLID